MPCETVWRISCHGGSLLDPQRRWSTSAEFGFDEPYERDSTILNLITTPVPTIS